MSDGTSIEIDLPKKLQDREYRRRYFLAEASARIAEQLMALRKKRHLNQKQVAELLGTHQPAISRAERADYHSWSFKTLRCIADALDARIQVFIEPSEEILQEYAPNFRRESEDYETPLGDAAKAGVSSAKLQQDQGETRRIVRADTRPSQ
jgi:transcriptional regulator with XRE-family HTH domain